MSENERAKEDETTVETETEGKDIHDEKKNRTIDGLISPIESNDGNDSFQPSKKPR